MKRSLARNWKLSAGLAACLLAAGSGSAAADWLVTREGGRIETRGPWKEKGKLLVFTTADGNLASLRLSEVDLDASRKATAEAEAAARAQAEARNAPQKPAEPKKEVFSITDKDVRPPAPPADAPAQPGQPSSSEAPAADGARQPGERLPAVTVVGWEREQVGTDGHVAITGTVRNDSEGSVADVRVFVQLFDDSGSAIATAPADLTATALMPGQLAAFRADFPSLFAFATVKVDVRGLRLSIRPREPAAPPEGG
ncbi:MAG TPA: FxLYD domain-containing protein [Thermoanaerobaculia bacterium]